MRVSLLKNKEGDLAQQCRCTLCWKEAEGTSAENGQRIH